MGPDLIGLVSLQDERGHQGAVSHRKDHGGLPREGDCPQPRREASAETSPDHSMILSFQPPGP